MTRPAQGLGPEAFRFHCGRSGGRHPRVLCPDLAYSARAGTGGRRDRDPGRRCRHHRAPERYPRNRSYIDRRRRPRGRVSAGWSSDERRCVAVRPLCLPAQRAWLRGPGDCGTLLEYANAGCGWNDLATLSAAQARTIRTGDTISLHWDWVCETLTPQQLRRLRHYTATQLRLANARGVRHRARSQMRSLPVTIPTGSPWSSTTATASKPPAPMRRAASATVSRRPTIAGSGSRTEATVRCDNTA